MFSWELFPKFVRHMLAQISLLYPFHQFNLHTSAGMKSYAYSVQNSNALVFLTGAVAILLLLAGSLLCAYELCAVYVTTGSSASERYSPSGFFFGVSAIALAINMLFICRMIFNGNHIHYSALKQKLYYFIG